MPERVLSSSFLLHFSSLFPSPSAVVFHHSGGTRYSFKPKSLVLWYLLLKQGVHSKPPTRDLAQLKRRVRSHLHKLQRLSARLVKYFKHAFIAYAA